MLDPEDKGVLKRFGSYFSPYKPQLIFALIAAVIVALSEGSVAFVGKLVTELLAGITKAVSGNEVIQIRFHREMWGRSLYDYQVTGPEEVLRMLWIIVLVSLAIRLLKNIFHFSKEYTIWRVTYRIVMLLKKQLFARVVNLPMAFYDRERSGDVVSRVTYDVSQIESSIRSTIVLAKSSIYLIVYIIGLFLMEWSLTLLVLGVFPILGFIIKLFGDRIRKFSRTVSLNVADYTAYLSEAIGGAMVIKAFGQEQARMKTFDAKIEDNFHFNMKIAFLNTLHAPSNDILSTLGMVGVIVFCAYRILYGGMTFGDLTGFVVLLARTYAEIKSLGDANNVIQRAIASGRRIFNLLDQPDENLVIGGGERKLPRVSGRIAFRGIRFAYVDDTPVLNGIDLEIAAGETVALVGPSGSGKSTLVRLIPRFYPLKEGRVELDEIDTAELDLGFLREQIAIVPQETVLFSGTVAENIRLGKPDATEFEVIEAAKASNSHDFIRDLPGGYEAQVGERGVQLSGGQRQRLAIARAILRNPRILLLDEATSSLDSESERLIQDALERFRRNRTTVVIAHRLSTVQSADRIAVIDRGLVAEIGPHRELYDRMGLYRKLYDQQFGL